MDEKTRKKVFPTFEEFAKEMNQLNEYIARFYIEAALNPGIDDEARKVKKAPIIKVDPKDGSISLSTKRHEMTRGEVVRNASAVFERVRLRQRGQGAATSSDVDMRLEA
jgi:hypothetical protein